MANIWHYIDKDDNDVIVKWVKDEVPKTQRIKLQAKIDMIAKEPTLPPQLLAPTGVNHIYKIKVQGNPKLRPLVCKGTVDNDNEYTLLVGAKEIEWEYEPNNALGIAVERREELLNDPTRRTKHKRLIN